MEFSYSFSNQFEKVIRQPFLTDRLKIAMKENTLYLIYLNEWDMATAAFTLHCSEARVKWTLLFCNLEGIICSSLHSFAFSIQSIKTIWTMIWMHTRIPLFFFYFFIYLFQFFISRFLHLSFANRIGLTPSQKRNTFIQDWNKAHHLKVTILDITVRRR